MLYMKYFVLKPEGNDKYAEASRKAMLKYADIIENIDSDLANDLRKWVQNENRREKQREE